MIWFNLINKAHKRRMDRKAKRKNRSGKREKNVIDAGIENIYKR